MKKLLGGDVSILSWWRCLKICIHYQNSLNCILEWVYSISLYVNYTFLKPINTFQSTSVIVQTKLLLIPLCTFFKMIFCVLIYTQMCLFTHTKKRHHFWSGITGLYWFLLFTLLSGSRFYHHNQLPPQSLLHNTQRTTLLWGERNRKLFWFLQHPESHYWQFNNHCTLTRKGLAM